ncbi:hypothetical protein [Sedimentitalea arenosa]|jgi:hypothetical protein|uniref:Uncharacterized protein n=1 Tax=Sedimentitalea arenosa TaxID=2798803 RepID=A0A8J7IHB2_9RHOB|nr:hypothetical protein [Arenibacterium arenosum]MBJ6370202.1 hypothetical protein [Arenibacterium arenosum]
MPKFNTRFELDVRDIELIETALQQRKKKLSLERLALLAETPARPEATTELAALDETLADIHKLLGRLHNQKVFFRPGRASPAPYVSG